MRCPAGFLLVLLLAIAGCGGGPSSSTASKDVPTASGLYTILIPYAGQSSARRSDSVSPAVISARISVPPLADQIIDLSPTSGNCTNGPGGRSCTFRFFAPLGTPTLTITLYDGPNGTGNALGMSSTTLTVTAQGFNANLTVNGNIASIVVNVSGSFTSGLASNGTVTVTAKDSGGNVVTGPGNYNNPITITNSDATGAFSLGATTIGAPGGGVTLSYNGKAVTGTITIGAQASGVSASNVTPATVVVGASPIPTVAPTASATATPTPTPPANPTTTPTPAQSFGPSPTPTASSTTAPVWANPSYLQFKSIRQTLSTTASQSSNPGNSFTNGPAQCSNGSGNFSITQPQGGIFSVTLLGASGPFSCWFPIYGVGASTSVWLQY